MHVSSVLDHRSHPLRNLPCLCFHQLPLHCSSVPFLAPLVLFLHPTHVSAFDPLSDGSFPSFPSGTVHGLLVDRCLCGPWRRQVSPSRTSRESV